MVPSSPSSSEDLSARSAHERRRRVRVDVLGQVDVHSVWKLQPLTLRELSVTGFSLETTSPVEVGTLQKFRLNLEGSGRSVVVQALTKHCTLQSASTGLAIYVAGFEFVGVTDGALKELVGFVTFVEALWRDEA